MAEIEIAAPCPICGFINSEYVLKPGTHLNMTCEDCGTVFKVEYEIEAVISNVEVLSDRNAYDSEESEWTDYDNDGSTDVDDED